MRPPRLHTYALALVCSLLALAACAASPEPASVEARADCNQLKDLDKTVAGCSAVITATPRDAGAHVSRGFAYFLQNKYDLASADFDSAIRLAPDRPDAYARRGLIFRVNGDDARAIADFTRAIDLGFSDPNIFVDRGVARLAQGDTPSAITDLTTAITRDADKTFVGQLAHITRGLAYMYSDRTAEAEQDFARAVALNPKEPFFALFLHLAETRLGLNPGLGAHTPSLDMTRWPAPVIRMFLDEEAPGSVQATKVGPVALCEALYFTAENAWLEGRRSEALGLHRMAVSRCPRHILESAASRAALRAMGDLP